MADMDAAQGPTERRRQGPRRHLRHHAARRRAVARRLDDARARSSRSPSSSTRWASTSSRPASRSPRNGDFEAVSEIAKRVKHAVVCGLARAGNADIDRAAEALQHAERRRIHTFIGTSPLHRKFQLQLEPEQVYERVVSSVTRARNYTDDVEWSPMDATRTEHDFLCRVRRGGDQGRRDHDQHPRHRRLRDAGGVPRPDPDAASSACRTPTR